MNRITLAIVTTICLATVAGAEEPVLSVDTDRIMSLARQAIAEQKDDIDPDSLEFLDITYRFDAKQKEHLRVSFRHSPQSETETSEDGERNLMWTITRSKQEPGQRNV